VVIYFVGTQGIKLLSYTSRLRAHGQLGAELLRLEVAVDEELDDAGGVLLNHDLAAEPAFLIVGVHDPAHLLDGIGNLGGKKLARHSQIELRSFEGSAGTL